MVECRNFPELGLDGTITAIFLIFFCSLQPSFPIRHCWTCRTHMVEATIDEQESIEGMNGC